MVFLMLEKLCTKRKLGRDCILCELNLVNACSALNLLKIAKMKSIFSSLLTATVRCDHAAVTEETSQHL